jgi:UDP-N-acetylmuramyl pentapeptide phosphotransferase/UDP-N-acetylglucosamine-1-phosphate transferase
VIPADEAVTALMAAVIGGATTLLLVHFRLPVAPKALMRTNVSGREVPAILGGPLVFGGLLAVLTIAILAGVGWDAAGDWRMTLSVSLVLAGMGVAGSWDDRRGDERPRGFGGHAAALRSRAFTGGVLKAAAGAVVGLGSGLLLGGGPLQVIETALIVALSANLLNLFDRAPGRAAKVSFLWAFPLVLLGTEVWTVAAAGTIGAVVACTPFDLRERAMLGDAGANPVGALLGLGLASSSSDPWRIVALLVLLGLNLASERWSFSKVIRSWGPLRWADDLGRVDDAESRPK